MDYIATYKQTKRKMQSSKRYRVQTKEERKHIMNEAPSLRGKAKIQEGYQLHAEEYFIARFQKPD